MEDKICLIFHHGLTISIELYLPHPEGATVALLITKKRMNNILEGVGHTIAL